MSLRELREKLQAPRRPYDTLYGRVVMRFFSIYLTALFARLGLRPVFATTLSLAAGLFGVWRAFHFDWLGGLLLLNLWYLLDHVDGELARHYRAASASGLFYDTILNAIVPPLAFAALGSSLGAASGESGWLYVGFAAAYASVMLLVIPYCEATVILQSGGPRAGAPPPVRAASPDAARRIFSALHTISTFPVFLPIATAAALWAVFFAPTKLVRAMQTLLFFYAGLASFIWIVVLAHAVVTRKVDKVFGPPA